MTRNAGNDPIVQVRPDRPAGGGLDASSAPRRGASWPRWVFVSACVLAISVGVLMLHTAGTTPHPHQGGLLTGAMATTSIAASLAYLAIMTILHFLPTGYNPIHHAVSDYGVGRYTGLFTVALYVSSVSVLALAFALFRAVSTPPLATLDLTYLLLIPLARIGMTFFPTSLEGQPITRTGLLHYGCAVAAFTLTYLAISHLTPALRALDPATWTRAPLQWTQWLVGPSLALVVITMLRPMRKLFGLFERIFLLTTNLWFTLAAGLLLSRLS